MTTPMLLERVRQRLIDVTGESGNPSPATVARALRDEGVVLGDDAMLSLVGALRDELSGAGPLEPLLRDPHVTDVLVNAPDQVWIDRGEGLQRSEVRFLDAEAIRRLAQRLASAAGRRLDESAPFVDAQLPDGTRLHAVIPPIARGSSVVSLRVPRRRAFTLEQLVEVGSVTPVGARWLRALIAARVAFLISGGTGTGKTTILATLLGCVESHERILIVEDSAELRPEHPHVVSLESRPANVEGAGRITLSDLVRQALRMRPDRVVVGEVRGAEMVDLLAALNTGHEGGCGTLHANSAADVPARLEALGLAAGLPRAAVHSLAAAGLDAIVHLRRDERGHRRVAGIHVMELDESGLVRAVPAVTFAAGDSCADQPGAAKLRRRLIDAGIAAPS
jgi:pilus assembly protein CpaF